MNLLQVLSLCILLPCGMICSKVEPPAITVASLQNPPQGIDLTKAHLLPRQQALNMTTDSEPILTDNGDTLTHELRTEPTNSITAIGPVPVSDVPLLSDSNPTEAVRESTSKPNANPTDLHDSSTSVTSLLQPFEAPTMTSTTTTFATVTQDILDSSTQQVEPLPSNINSDTSTSTSTSTPTPTPTPDALTTLTTTLAESTVTSVSPTLVLGDMECATHPLAQPDRRCPPDHYCNAALKQCAAQINNGQVCAADFQCMSAYCMNATCADRPKAVVGALSGGQLVGITLGSTGGAIALVILLLCFYRRQKRRIAAKRNQTLYSRTEMAGNPRLSKYNYLAQILDDQQLNSRALPANIQHYPSTSSSSASALRPPRPFTGNLTPPPSIFAPSLHDYYNHPSSDSEGISTEQRRSSYTNSMEYHYASHHRPSLTDTTVSSRLTDQLPLHNRNNPLWDDALPPPSYHRQPNYSH